MSCFITPSPFGSARKRIITAIAILFFSLPSLSWAQQYFTGDGGSGVRVTVSELTGRGLSAQEQQLLHLAQGTIIGAFQKFSAMTVFDRQNLEKILSEQKLSMTGNFSDKDYIRIGELTNARFVVFGSITKTSTSYTLELSVSDVQSGERKASFLPKQISLLALESHSAVREASADLLGQLGVNLTAGALSELKGAQDAARVQAENAVARGIAAQRQGTVVEALSYFIQASNIDAGVAEAASRMNILSANISSGNIGDDTRNDIAWRKQWIERLQEAENFFANYTKEIQPYSIVYNPEITWGDINYTNSTREARFTMYSYYSDKTWADTINKVISTVKTGFDATKRAREWGLDWPARSVGSSSPFGSNVKNYAVIAEIINSEGRSIGKQTVNLSYGYNVRNGQITQVEDEKRVNFPAVNANLITDQLSIRITSIDGMPVERASQQRKISVLPLAEYNRIHGIGIYQFKNDEGIIIGYTGNETNIVIHAAINGVKVTAINMNAFSNKGLTSVTIPSSVTSIGGSAFARNQLTNVTIPSSVTYIVGYAFAINQLTSVTIPSSVTSIGVSAFARNQLTNVTIPSSVTSIGNGAFAINQLTNVTIPSTVASIGEEAFANNQLSSITIGANVKIGKNAFSIFNDKVNKATIIEKVNSSEFNIRYEIFHNKGKAKSSGFEKFYEKNKKKAGTYTYDGKNWSYTP